MIEVGLTGWGDHDTLYQDIHANKMKLQTYSNHFPVVELDSSFYAIQSERNYIKWVDETPLQFSFVIKAYQGMTGHMRGEIPFVNRDEMFAAFKQSIAPVLQAGKVKAVLFQYPPWFDCSRKHVNMLLYTKEKMGNIPCAIEFRNATWYQAAYSHRTLTFLSEQGWIHTICDEPQTSIGSVPIVLEVTHPELTLIRLHGRNIYGWQQGAWKKNWRAVRCLYRYSEEEMQEWANVTKMLQQHSKNIVVLFNNNSGGDAADNAKVLMRLLNLTSKQDGTLQMKLF